MNHNLLLFFLFLGVYSCNPKDPTEPNSRPFDDTAYRPIYISEKQLAEIESLPPQSLKKAGKIYVKGSYLFINDLGRGIHIVDNQDPKKPKRISFLKILGNYDIAVKVNWLYADNATDLVVFDISIPTAPKFVERVANAIPLNNYPPYQRIYFDCVDNSKGIVIGWEKYTTSLRPKCYR